MTVELIFNLIAVAALVIFGCLALGAVRIYLKNKAERERAVEAWGDVQEEAELVEIRGRITEKHCSTEVKGTKTLELYKEFYLVFESEDGTRERFDVDEEIYLEVAENQAGTAAIVGSRFYGFCPDVNE